MTHSERRTQFVRALRAEAISKGATVVVAACDRALAGDQSALPICEEAAFGRRHGVDSVWTAHLAR